MCQTEPAEEAKRRSLSSALENEGLFLHGFAPFAPFRDRLLSCRATARLPAQPRTVLAALFPYQFTDNGPRNLSRYACVPDYHDAAGRCWHGPRGDWRRTSPAFPSSPSSTIPPAGGGGRGPGGTGRRRR